MRIRKYFICMNFHVMGLLAQSRHRNVIHWLYPSVQFWQWQVPCCEEVCLYFLTQPRTCPSYVSFLTMTNLFGFFLRTSLSKYRTCFYDSLHVSLSITSHVMTIQPTWIQLHCVCPRHIHVLRHLGQISWRDGPIDPAVRFLNDLHWPWKPLPGFLCLCSSLRQSNGKLCPCLSVKSQLFQLVQIVGLIEIMWNVCYTINTQFGIKHQIWQIWPNQLQFDWF